ncbi:MAG: neutral/alkaline non-lysosomal ceramidase N-terminal domain-containing protein [Limisphaerales bacterium]
MIPWRFWKALVVFGCWFGFLDTLLEAAPPLLVPVGVSRIDISPTNAVPLMGYAARSGLPAPTNLAQRLHARALAIGSRKQAAVLVTIDNCILPGAITEEIRSRLARRVGLAPAQVALTVTHTHSAPCLTGAAPNIFARDLTPAEQDQIAGYTAYFTDRIEEAARLALDRRRPARIAWGKGSVGFAKNRRTPGGPVDHDLPLLRISDPNGELRAVLVSYACHCTTLSGELNAVHGDWAGAAAEAFERDHPGATALVAIGAGADANPDPRGTIELATRHGEALAAEATRLVKLPLQDLPAAPTCRLQTLPLPFQPHFSREEWVRRSTNSGIVGFHARRWLARLDRGETLSPTLPYPVQTWVFGNRMAMVFLGGEVVVDYSLRLKRELDSQRIWVNAYANDVPCYIPSRRILDEGGYEAETSLWYYDRPQRLAPAIEDQIIEAVREQLPKLFRVEPTRAEHRP